jgi:hypothetical protein
MEAGNAICPGGHVAKHGGTGIGQKAGIFKLNVLYHSSFIPTYNPFNFSTNSLNLSVSPIYTSLYQINPSYLRLNKPPVLTFIFVKLIHIG